MSNQLLGNVYLRIMDDVIENCQTTFEEDGVNQQTLEDLKSRWQTKLTALKVGTFPWEPPPVPQPMLNPTLPSNVPRPIPGPSNGTAPVPSNGAPRIKTEPGTEPAIPNLGPNYGNNDARERAMAKLQEKFGPEANAQIHQLQSQMLPNGQVRPPPNLTQPRPVLTPEQQRQQQEEYQRRQHAAAYSQMQRMAPAPVPVNSRTDGSDDWDGYVVQRRQQAAESIRQGDMTIRQQVEQQSRATEAGGLMMPLAEQSDQPQVKRRKVDAEGPSIPQLDGLDDDDDDETVGKPVKHEVKDELFGDNDDDAINSDLDDPDDNEIEEENDGEPQPIMLCTYDKVQRVKNKWKCTLRDGVLYSGGKEYVFGKANGEFEW